MMDINTRAQDNLVVSETLYVSGLLNMIEDLIYELENQMTAEGRHFGIVLSYFHSLRQAFEKVNKDICSEDLELYGRIIFLYKNMIYREYKKLCKKRLSKADALITLIRKLLLIVKEKSADHPKEKEINTVFKIIDKLWENIKNTKKNSSLYGMCETIKAFMKQGKVGKMSYEHLSIEEEEAKKAGRRKGLEDGDSGLRFENGNEVKEIEWTGE